MRGQYISAIKAACKEHIAERGRLQSEECRVQVEYAAVPGDATFASLEGAKRQLALFDTNFAHNTLAL